MPFVKKASLGWDLFCLEQIFVNIFPVILPCVLMQKNQKCMQAFSFECAHWISIILKHVFCLENNSELQFSWMDIDVYDFIVINLPSESWIVEQLEIINFSLPNVLSTALRPWFCDPLGEGADWPGRGSGRGSHCPHSPRDPQSSPTLTQKPCDPSRCQRSQYPHQWSGPDQTYRFW